MRTERCKAHLHILAVCICMTYIAVAGCQAVQTERASKNNDHEMNQSVDRVDGSRACLLAPPPGWRATQPPQHCSQSAELEMHRIGAGRKTVRYANRRITGNDQRKCEETGGLTDRERRRPCSPSVLLDVRRGSAGSLEIASVVAWFTPSPPPGTAGKKERFVRRIAKWHAVQSINHFFFSLRNYSHLVRRAPPPHPPSSSPIAPRSVPWAVHRAN